MRKALEIRCFSKSGCAFRGLFRTRLNPCNGTQWLFLKAAIIFAKKLLKIVKIFDRVLNSPLTLWYFIAPCSYFKLCRTFHFYLMICSTFCEMWRDVVSLPLNWCSHCDHSMYFQQKNKCYQIWQHGYQPNSYF